MTPEDYWYLPPDPPTTERRCPAEVPSDSPWDPAECGHPTEGGETLCRHHQATLSDEEQLWYEHHHAA